MNGPSPLKKPNKEEIDAQEAMFGMIGLISDSLSRIANFCDDMLLLEARRAKKDELITESEFNEMFETDEPQKND